MTNATRAAKLRNDHDMTLLLFSKEMAEKLGISVRAAMFALDGFLELVVEEDPTLWDDTNLHFTPEGMIEVHHRLKALTDSSPELIVTLLLYAPSRGGSSAALTALTHTAIAIQETAVARDELIALAMKSRAVLRADIADAAQLSEGRLHQIKDEQAAKQQSA